MPSFAEPFIPVTGRPTTGSLKATAAPWRLPENSEPAEPRENLSIRRVSPPSSARRSQRTAQAAGRRGLQFSPFLIFWRKPLKIHSPGSGESIANEPPSQSADFEITALPCNPSPPPLNSRSSSRTRRPQPSSSDKPRSSSLTRISNGSAAAETRILSASNAVARFHLPPRSATSALDEQTRTGVPPRIPPAWTPTVDVPTPPVPWQSIVTSPTCTPSRFARVASPASIATSSARTPAKASWAAPRTFTDETPAPSADLSIRIATWEG